MSLKDLMAKTIGHTVARTDGISEQVLYTAKVGGLTKAPIQAIVERDLEEDVVDKEKKEFTLFHALTLPQPPSQGDTIQFEGQIWTYHRTRDSIGNTYDVIAYVKKYSLGRSVTR